MDPMKLQPWQIPGDTVQRCEEKHHVWTRRSAEIGHFLMRTLRGGGLGYDVREQTWKQEAKHSPAAYWLHLG